MAGWNSFFTQLGLDMTVYLAGVAFFWSLERKDNFLIRITICLSSGAVLSVVFSAIRTWLPLDYNLLVTLNVFWMFVRFLILILQSHYCVKRPLSSGIYYAAWSMVLQQMTYETGFIILAILNLEKYVIPLSIIWFSLLYIAIPMSIERRKPGEREYPVGVKQLTLSIVMAVIAGCLYQLFFYLAPELSFRQIIITFAQLYCATIFYIQSIVFKKNAIREELLTMNLLWKQNRDRYSLAKENIDLINQKCHDLKHQIKALKDIESSEVREKYIAELEQSIQIYDAIVKTGNDTLDTILTEKSLYCERNQILVNCVADGSRLDFIHPVDLYAIFGNAMDNAIETVGQIADSGRRVIDVLVYTKQQFLIINITNPMGGVDLVFEDGLPTTTKDQNGYHGFGMKSIHKTAEKYGGFVTVDAKDDVFSLRILFPLSKCGG